MRRIGMLGFMLMVSGLLACGGEEPLPGPQLRQAPLWMTEADLPGCEALPARRLATTELLEHPMDAQLVLVTNGGMPVCISSRNTAFQAGGDAPSGEDDPIPLVRDPDRDDGEADDDPIPVVRLAREHPASDDPIPLVRERDLSGAKVHPAPAPGHEDR